MPICRNRITSEPIIDIVMETRQCNSGKIQCKLSGSDLCHGVDIVNHSPCRVSAEIQRGTVGNRVEFETKGSANRYVKAQVETVTVGARMCKPGPFQSPRPRRENFDIGIRVVLSAPPMDIIETDVDYQEHASSGEAGVVDGDVAVRL